jgi:carbonic anhydrase
MKKTISLLLLAISITLLTTGCNKSSHWGYTGNEGPKYWGTLDERFTMCSEGKMQTPIDIIPTKNVKLDKLGFEYLAKATTVINNGHTIQVNIASGSTLNIDGLKFELKQFHFHTPSENNIKGHQYPLEAHFVHATADGKLAVVAVMFEEGEANPILSKIWSKFPLETNKEVAIELSSENIKSLMPYKKEYYKFMGSLTTPPCSENVRWNVLKTTMTISKEQVKQFFDIYGHSNNRPIQATNEREIL